MIRFAVLNEEEQTKSKEEESVEIQAEKCLGIYESAIRLLQKNQLDDSRKMLKNLIESDLMQKIDNNSEVAARGTPLRRLQYLVYTNYAYILEQVSDHTSALQFYLKAIAFDNSDNSLWVKIGTLAAKEKKLKVARYALECGMQQQPLQQQQAETAGHDFEPEDSLFSDTITSMDQDLTPTQWSCLQTLCEVLYEIGDFVACEDYIQKALRISPYFERGVELRNLIRSRFQESVQGSNGVELSGNSKDDFVHQHLGLSSHSEHMSGSPKEVYLEELSWLSLGEQLLEEYKSLVASSEKVFYNQRLVVRTQKAQDEVERGEEDIEMLEEPTKDEEPVAAEPEAEDAMLVDVKTAAEPASLEPTDASASMAVTSDDAAEQGDKENGEAEQSAAMKRKRREVEERSGLRTSKRVRDKLEQFEETKRKREEEEQEMLAKYRIVLSKFGMDMNNAHVSGTKADALRSEDIFPSGLSGLLVTFNKHLERPNALVQASTIEHVQQQKTNHFAIFNLEKNEPPTASFFDDNTTLLDFINRTNDHNSGVVEYLCGFVMVVMSGLTSLEAESNWQKRWPCGLRTVLSSIVCVIEDQLLEYLNQESRSDEAKNVIEQRIVLELQLSICEMYLDEMVHAILHPFTVVSRKGRGAKKVDAEHVAKLDKQFQRWLYLAGLGLEVPLSSSTKKGVVPSTILWLRAAVLRFNWMLGRHAQCLGNASQAISRFEECAQHLKNDPSVIIHMPNCKYDTTVDAERIQERLGRLKTHQYVLDAARLFKEKDYSAVMTRLEPIFLKEGASNRASTSTDNNDDDEEKAEADIADTIGGSLSERLELMGLLYKSCEALENRPKQFHCITEMFVLVVETLVNTITDKSEATEVWFLFGQVSHTLYLLRETLQSTNLSSLLCSLESHLLQRLVCCVLAIARLGFVNVLHQDRLVDDDIKLQYSDLLKHRPHLEQFNLVLIRVWLVLLSLLPGWIQGTAVDEIVKSDAVAAAAEDVDHTTSKPLPLNIEPLDMKAMQLDREAAQRVLSQPLTTNSKTALRFYTCPSQELYMELIALVHDDLGVRGICGLDDNQLIKLALKVSSPLQGPFYRKEENQCYYCFYGISLSVDGQYPIEHSSVTIDFDRTAATEFFPLLERSLSDRVLRGQVRGDLKDAVDRVEEALGSPPYESNSILEMNRQIVDGYLASEIDFAEAIQVTSKSQLPTMAQPPSSKLASVYRRIYAIHGKIFLAQFRNKAKNNQFKPLEDLQHAIDQFQTDLHVNPECWDSWYSLASCYAFLADENLVFSASDIKNNYSKITDLQKRAFHCFAQAVRLAPKRNHRGTGGSGKGGHGNNNGVVAAVRISESQNQGQSQGHADSEMGAADDRRLEPEVNGDGRGLSEDRESLQSNEVRETGVDNEWYEQQAAFWFDFGNLIHGIMSKPMRMEAMRRTGGLEMMSSETGETMTIPIPEPSEEQAYKFAVFCFKRSLSLNDQNWRTSFMLGKCLEKLEGQPKEVLKMYRMAADKVPKRSGQQGNEKIFEAAYKIISTLSKYLTVDKIEPSLVESLMNKTLAKSKLSAVDGESFIFEPPKEYLQAIESDPPSEEDAQKKEKLHAFRLLCEGLARIRHTDKRHWHHRPVFRQAWILYHIYHDVERAKAEMLSLFQVKSNLKTLVSSVWKPEFERSGKHFVYVGEYTKFLIVLAKETGDVETLNSLARKIRRATGLLLDLKEIWELLYDSYLAVLADLVGPAPAIPVAEVIPRTEFREKAAIYEAKMFGQGHRLAGLAVLQRLCELKKLNEKMAPEGEMGQLLAVCYSKLFIEVGGAELYPKELVRQLSSNTEQDVTMTSNGAAAVAVEGQLDPDGQNSVKEGVAEAGQDNVASTENVSQQVRDIMDDQEEVRAQMSKLTTELSTSTDATALNGFALPAIVIDDNERKTEDQPEASDNSGTSAGQASGSNNSDMAVPSIFSGGSGIETPSSPAPSINAKDNEATTATTTTTSTTNTSVNMDVEPDMEDWKSRKKISAAELASRATTMCKAPPPSLKAPQSLQSKLAGPEILPVTQQEEEQEATNGLEEPSSSSRAQAQEQEQEQEQGQEQALEGEGGKGEAEGEGDEEGGPNDESGDAVMGEAEAGKTGVGESLAEEQGAIQGQAELSNADDTPEDDAQDNSSDVVLQDQEGKDSQKDGEEDEKDKDKDKEEDMEKDGTDQTREEGQQKEEVESLRTDSRVPRTRVSSKRVSVRRNSKLDEDVAMS